MIILLRTSQLPVIIIHLLTTVSDIFAPLQIPTKVPAMLDLELVECFLVYPYPLFQ